MDARVLAEVRQPVERERDGAAPRVVDTQVRRLRVDRRERPGEGRRGVVDRCPRNDARPPKMSRRSALTCQ